MYGWWGGGGEAKGQKVVWTDRLFSENLLIDFVHLKFVLLACDAFLGFFFFSRRLCLFVCLLVLFCFVFLFRAYTTTVYINWVILGKRNSYIVTFKRPENNYR